MQGLSLVVASGATLHRGARGLSLSRPLVAGHRLQTRRLSNCGSRDQLLGGMWDLPRPGLKLVFPALAGRFSTTAPPGKPQVFKVTSEWGHFQKNYINGYSASINYARHPLG